MNYEKKARIYKCKLSAMTDDLVFASKKGIEIVFFANKKGNSLQTNIPIQARYNSSPYWQNQLKLAPSRKKNSLRKFILYLLFISRKWRPEFIDRTWGKLKTKNKLTYIGRY